MADCECVPRCPFFNGRMAQVMPAVVEGMKKRYCQGDKLTCARYRIFTKLGKEAVPADLVPNQKDRADAILAKG